MPINMCARKPASAMPKPKYVYGRSFWWYMVVFPRSVRGGDVKTPPCNLFFLICAIPRYQHLHPSTSFFSKKLFEVYVQDESHGLGLMACKPFSLLLEEAFFQAFRICSPLLGPNDLCVPSFFFGHVISHDNLFQF